DRTWSYATSFPLTRQDDDWLIGWTPAVVHPSLAEGELLEATRTVGARGRIVATDGSVLLGPSGRVVVGIRKSRATELAATAREVASRTDVVLAELDAKLATAVPDDFVEVTTLARPAYDRIRDRIQPLPGTVFRVDEGERAVPAGFAKGV